MILFYRDETTRAIAEEGSFLEGLPHDVSTELRATVQWMKIAVTSADLRVLPHIDTDGDETDPVVDLGSGFGLAYMVNGDEITVTGVLATERST